MRGKIRMRETEEGLTEVRVFAGDALLATVSRTCNSLKEGTELAYEAVREAFPDCEDAVEEKKPFYFDVEQLWMIQALDQGGLI